METFFHRAGSHVYGYTTGYLGLSLLSTRALGFTLTVVPSQASYKIQAAVGVGMVNILVDGLLAAFFLLSTARPCALWERYSL